MNSELNSLWLDWRAKVPNGVPNPSNDYHLVLLKELCLERNIDQEIIDDVILALEKVIIGEMSLDQKNIEKSLCFFVRE